MLFFPFFRKKKTKTTIKQSTAISRFGQNTEANVKSILSLSLTYRQGDQQFSQRGRKQTETDWKYNIYHGGRVSVTSVSFLMN